jgi:hypothetical protein
MEYYLCKHCKSITNLAAKGPCEESGDGDHEWVSGKKAETFIHRLWQSPVEMSTTQRTHSTP